MSILLPLAIGFLAHFLLKISHVRIGKISRFLAPGYTHCEHCGTNWYYVIPHEIRTGNGGGFFVLCKKCDKEVDLVTKQRYLRAVRARHWHEMPEEKFKECITALERDHVDGPEIAKLDFCIYCQEVTVKSEQQKIGKTTCLNCNARI